MLKLLKLSWLYGLAAVLFFDLSAATTNDLIWAVRVDDAGEVSRLILDEGVDPNATDEVGNLPLTIAARLNLINLVHLLSALGAQINARDDGGYSALDVAQFYELDDMAEHLMSLGAVCVE